jgi:hypothetical protein
MSWSILRRLAFFFGGLTPNRFSICRRRLFLPRRFGMRGGGSDRLSSAAKGPTANSGNALEAERPRI